MNKQKQQSSIAEKWNEILKKWKDYPVIDDSIAPWPLSCDFNKYNQTGQSDKK